MAEINVKDFVKPERKKKIAKKRADNVPLIGALIVALLIGVAFGIEAYANWRVDHQWQSPVVFRSPVKVIEKQVEHTKTLEEITKPYKLQPVLQSIYMLESTSGKNDGCKEKGQFNGYGYRQNSKENKCYNSFEEVTGYVNEWFEDRLSTNGNNLIEAVCLYNTGYANQSTCGDYSENFWSVLTNYF